MTIPLGVTVEDRITGHRGIVTGFVVYLSGCNQALVTGRVVDGKAPEAMWIDEQRLVIDTAVATVVLDNSRTPGADAAPPVR